ncbi:MAG TPA: lysine--tRNA ligase [Planctomycetaceae bacterium]|jgi:lysyl-tRNA synthetase class 2|nr:lysine--tRNA ligase [Planctomycetaceae bacterium]
MSDAPPGSSDPQRPDRFEQERLKKLEAIEALGLDPWGHRFDGHIPIAAARAQAPAEAGLTGDSVRVAGRLMLRNNKGKLKFYHLQDATGRIQLMVSKADVSEQQWKLIENLDLGDIIGVDGTLRLTNTGEVTVFVKELTMLGKSLAQPPEKFHGARDTEMLLRQRYIDLIYSEGVLPRMLKRTKILESIRDTLRAHNYLEVETPVLQAIAGGAAARPFVTHHNALDIPLYLRIALELYLKRLMVGGIERVYEIGRVFRNEGVDSTHNPEFTMLELYQAYGNYETMMDLTEAIVVNAVRVVSETPVIQWRGAPVDFSSPWPRRKYAELFEQYAGCPMCDAEAVQKVARQHGIETSGVHPDVLIQEVFETLVERHLEGPIFVLDYPASLCPLTKRKASDPNIAERFELFVRGMELANAYTELNDPRLQEQLFSTQLAGLPPEESMARMDHDFIRALKVGMPAAGGMGLGIDRLVMLLTDSYSIRDVIFFPLLKPET